jgi:GH24 family phage-related lysozyme (muramidase)
MIEGDDAQVMQAGLVGNNKFIKRIMDDEGKPFLEATKVFDDEKNFTIGYGRNNASIKKGDKITLEEAQKNLAEDVEIRLEEIQDLIPNFSNLSDQLQLALFSEYYRGSVRQSPKTVKLINEGRFSEAAAEFLDNDEYRNAVDRGRRGIRKRMKRVFNLLRREGTEDSPAV